jgi:hypothetical protein
MLTSTAPIQLDYAFIPSPNPIRVSQSAGDTSIVDLQVIISDPLLSGVTVSEITIEIPTGEATSRAISTASNLPSPRPDPSDLWSFTAYGSTITIKPTGTSPASVTNPIVFTIPGVQVNECVGQVPITITEFNPPAPKAVNSGTYSLVKQPADFPVSNFYASSTALYDLDQPTTLYWVCTPRVRAIATGCVLPSSVAGFVQAEPRRARAPVRRPRQSHR